MHKTIDYSMLAGYDVMSQYIGLHSDISLFPTHTQPTMHFSAKGPYPLGDS